jgi:hypothetical protein
MPFIDPNDIAANATLIGEQDGTAAIYLVRQTVSAGTMPGCTTTTGTKPSVLSQARSAAALATRRGCVVLVRSS